MSHRILLEETTSHDAAASSTGSCQRSVQPSVQPSVQRLVVAPEAHLQLQLPRKPTPRIIIRGHNVHIDYHPAMTSYRAQVPSPSPRWVWSRPRHRHGRLSDASPNFLVTVSTAPHRPPRTQQRTNNHNCTVTPPEVTILLGNNTGTYNENNANNTVISHKHRFWLPRALQAPLVELGYGNRILSVERLDVLLNEEEALVGKLVPLPLHIHRLGKVYTEGDCRALVKQVCEILAVLGAHGTVHGALHLNHLMVDPATGKVSLYGFRNAVVLQDGGLGETSDNQPGNNNDDATGKYKYDWFAFSAPEPVPHAKTDLWSLGVCLYVLLTGLPPFRASGSALRRQKAVASIAPMDDVTSRPSAAAQTLVRGLLTVDIEERLSIGEVIEHDWFRTEGVDMVADNDLSLVQTLFGDWDRRRA